MSTFFNQPKNNGLYHNNIQTRNVVPSSMHQINGASRATTSTMPMPKTTPTNFINTSMPPPPSTPRKTGFRPHEPHVVQQGFDRSTMEYVYRYSDGSIKRVGKNINDGKLRGKRDLSAGLYIKIVYFIITFSC